MTPPPLSPLGLTGIPPIRASELDRVASTGFLGIFDQETDTQAQHWGRADDSPSSRSRPLSPLPEDPLNPDIQALFYPTSLQSTIHREGTPARTSTAFQPFSLLRPIIRPTKRRFRVIAEYAKYKWMEQIATTIWWKEITDNPRYIPRNKL